jgi:WD40 repeat protein
MDVKFIFKFLIPAIATLAFTLRVAHVCADTCDLAGHGMQICISGTDESRLFIWSAKGVEKQKTASSTGDSEDRLNMASGASDKRSESLPQDLVGPDLRFDVPFALSHDRTMLIATIHPNFIALPLSRKFAIVDLKNRKALHVIETKDYVESLAWSPTDKYLAVLFSQDATGQKWKGPLDWISKFLGHPISYYTFYIAIYDRAGQSICKKLLIEKVPQGGGYIEWQ